MSAQRASRAAAGCHDLDEGLLCRWPLPAPDPGGDKDTRGAVLVIAGSREMPGAAVLAATAALHAGAGKLIVATAASVAAQVGVSVPEARVLGLNETRAGGLSRSSLTVMAEVLEDVGAVLVGPGMIDPRAAGWWALHVLRNSTAPVVLDAIAMDSALACADARASALVLTPHAGEMARLVQVEKSEVLADPIRAACETAARCNAIVALKGACTVIAAPDGQTWRHESHHVGLATSGSGDVLAGVIAGLLARGARADQAAAWGVVLHAGCGRRVMARGRPLGYLARELSQEIPALMHDLALRA